MAAGAGNPIVSLGALVLGGFRYAGGLTLLLGDTLRWAAISAITPRRREIKALGQQVVRVGVKSIGIVALVQGFIGIILMLQLTPTLATYGQESQIAAVIGIAGFRMLGPIFTAVVLSGFAGASIAAELGTMVVAEEIAALRAMALNPVRFLVVPRVAATFVAMLLLTSFADFMIAVGGYVTAILAIGPTVYIDYWEIMRESLVMRDFLTGLVQSGVFGLLIGTISCFEGLRVQGGAEGVGRATTLTVVYSIVAIVLAACTCTVLFYAWDL